MGQEKWRNTRKTGMSQYKFDVQPALNEAGNRGLRTIGPGESIGGMSRVCRE
ncbi:hypothetical protein KOR42_40270 [Thalassoglobus neptunius]|uniref:Uncharacterized protein n=1 Tax=Thalassoglobus neptunius TaxID=1938619 RepID=A0A5C5WBE7_9PLAN|nr:hypothetical protein KOR42_40270 [Thalassoglobus neptunius]